MDSSTNALARHSLAPPGRVAREAGGARVGLRQVQKTAPPGAVCESRGLRAVFCMSAAAAPPARRRRPHAANRKGREITRECGFWAALRPPALLPCRGMRTAIALALLLAACKSAPAPQRQLNAQAALHPRSKQLGEDPAYVQALREELEALRRIQAVLGWYAGTQGETSLQKLTYVGHDRLFQKAALDAIAAAEQQPGVTQNDALALRFVRRTLAGEIVRLSTASFSDEYADVEAAATVTLPWKDT